MNKYTYHNAIANLYANVSSSSVNSEGVWSAKDTSGNDITLDMTAIKAEFDKNNYVNNRKYPSLQEQFDLQYWDQINGTTKWKEAIAKVKSDNPKL